MATTSIGSVLPGLTVTVVDNTTGLPKDPATLTLTLTAPDGTTSTPSPAHPSAGVYVATVIATQAGMYHARWVAVGNNCDAAWSQDVYVMASTPGLVTVAETAAYLRIGASTLANYQDRLVQWIQASRLLIEEQVGDLVITAHDEWYDGGASTIVLLEAPVASVTSVTETFGANVVRALTAQVLDGVTPVDAYGYTLDYETGVMIRRVTGIAAPFALGRRNVRVVYSTGLAGVWRENYRLANLECLRTWWVASQQGSSPQAMNGDDSGVDYAGVIGELPPRVMRMLGRRTRIPGIA